MIYELKGWLLFALAVALLACGGVDQRQDPYATELPLVAESQADGKFDGLATAGEHVEHYASRYGELHINKILPSRGERSLRTLHFFLKVDRSKAEWNGWRLQEVGMRESHTITEYGAKRTVAWHNVAARRWNHSDHYFSLHFNVSSDYHSVEAQAVFYAKLRHTADGKRVRYLWIHRGDGQQRNFDISLAEWQAIDPIRLRAGLPSIGYSPEHAVPTWWDDLYRRYNPARLR